MSPNPPGLHPVRSLLLINSLCMGGAEKQVVALFNGMSRLRHTVSLLCIKQDEALLPQIDPAMRPQVLPSLGVRRGLNLAALRRLAACLDQQATDVLVCTNMYALLYGWLARRLCQRRAQIKLVEVFHTTDVGSRRERWSMALYRQLLRSTDLLVYVCHGQAAHWRRQGLRARQDMVIYNGVDTTVFDDRSSAAERAARRLRHGLAARDYVVGLCAVMRPEKAHGDLLQALALLRREGLPVRCLLIGDGPERPRIERQVAALGLGEVVRITGQVDDVRAAVLACDVMVLASHTVETFSIAALEALSLGRPMVMTRIGGASEQVLPGTNGLLYPAGDTVALADCLRLLADAALREPMGERAAGLVRQCFGLERMVRRYESALQAMVAGQPVASDPRAGPAAH